MLRKPWPHAACFPVFITPVVLPKVDAPDAIVCCPSVVYEPRSRNTSCELPCSGL